MEQTKEPIDWNAEAKKINEAKGNYNYFNPDVGTYKILPLNDGEKYVKDIKDEKSGVVKHVAKFRANINVKDVEYSWVMGQGSTPSSLYGQIVLFAEHNKGLKNNPFTLVVKSDGKKRDYTILEVVDLVAKIREEQKKAQEELKAEMKADVEATQTKGFPVEENLLFSQNI